MTSINIPEGVTSIGNYTFQYCTGLTSINIPESVTSIGNSAFSGCRGLTSINIPEGVTSIGDYAFSSCSGLTSINIPEAVTSIGNYSFNNCSSLKTVSLCNGDVNIASNAFNKCSNISDIYLNFLIPDQFEQKLDLISQTATLNVHPSNFPAINNSDWIYKNRVVYIPLFSEGGIKYELISTEELSLRIIGFEDDAETVTFNESVYDLPITEFAVNMSDYPGITHIIYNRPEVPANLFRDMTGLKVLELGQQVTSIGDNAFSGVNFDVVTTAASVPPVLGLNAFDINDPKFQLYFSDELAEAYNADEQWGLYFDLLSSDGGSNSDGWAYDILSEVWDISNLKVRITGIPADMSDELVIPVTIDVNGHTAQVTEINLNSIPEGSSFTSLRIEDSGLPLALGTDLSTLVSSSRVYIGRNIEPASDFNIEKPLFGYNRITEVEFGHEVTKIPARMFEGSLRIPAIDLSATQVDSIGDCAFKKITLLKTLVLPSTLKYIGKEAFVGARFTGVEMPESLEEIDNSAFYTCNYLESIAFNSPINRIGNEAFASCSKLRNIAFNDTIGLIDNRAFADLTLDSLDVKAGTIKADAFSTVKVNGEAAVRISAPVIEPQAFKNMQALNAVSLILHTGSDISADFLDGLDMPAAKGFDLTAGVIQANPFPATTINPENLTLFHINAPEIKKSVFENLTLPEGADVVLDIAQIRERAFYKMSAPNFTRFEINTVNVQQEAFYMANISSEATLYINVENKIGMSAFSYINYNGAPTPLHITGNEIESLSFSKFSPVYVSGKKLMKSAFMGVSSSYFYIDCETIYNNIFGSSANSYNTYLETIDLGENVKIIETQAFRYNKNLSTVNFRNCKLQRIGTFAFSSTKITSLVFPTIEGATPECVIDNAFSDSPISYLDLGNTVKEIGSQYLPINVEHINLGSAEIVRGFTHYPDSLFVPASVKEFVVNVNINLPGLHHIVFEASDEPVTMTQLGNDLVSAEINREVITTQNYTGTIERLVYPDTDERKFNAYICAADSIYLGSGVATANFTADCAPSSFSMADGVEGIVVANGATLSLPIEDLHIPSSMTLMAGNISLPTNFKLNLADGDPASVLDMKNLIITPAEGRSSELYCGRNIALEGYSLGRLNTWNKAIFGDNVTAIAEHCFDGSTGLETAVISPNVTTIGNSAFKNCSSLGTIEFSENLTTINAGAYDGCTGIDKIIARGTVPPEGDFAFSDETAECTPLYVPEESVMDYADSNNFIFFDLFENLHTLAEANVTDEIEANPTQGDQNFTAGSTHHFPSLFEIIFHLYKGLTGQHAPAVMAARAKAPAAPSVDDLLWVSSDTRIASVEHDGTVTFHSEDPVRITAYATDGSGKHISFDINADVAGDINRDGKFDYIDINYLINGLLDPESNQLPIKVSDFNGDGVINYVDVNYGINELLNQ